MHQLQLLLLLPSRFAAFSALWQDLSISLYFFSFALWFTGIVKSHS